LSLGGNSLVHESAHNETEIQGNKMAREKKSWQKSADRRIHNIKLVGSSAMSIRTQASQ